MTFNIGDVVIVKETREVSPLCEVRSGQMGIIKDVTCPDYYLVDFGNCLVKWICGSFLDLKR